MTKLLVVTHSGDVETHECDDYVWDKENDTLYLVGADGKVTEELDDVKQFHEFAEQEA